MTHRPFLFTLLIAAASATLLAACGGGKTDEPTNAGFVRLLNATSGPLDLVDGSSAISSVGANSVGGYVSREPATHDFIVRSGGNAGPTLSVGVQRQQRYTIAAYASGGTLTTAYLTDDEGAPRAGAAKLRVFNTAAADAGSVDVYLVAAACSALAGTAAAPVAGAVTGLQSGYVQVGAAGYHLCVTSQGDKNDLRLDIPAAAFADQQIVTLILKRGAGGVLLNGLLLNQQAAATVAPNASARVRVAAGPSTGLTLAASANGVSLGQGYTAPAMGGYKLVSAGALSLSVTIGSTTSTPAVGNTPTVAGGDYTLLVSGTEAAPTATLIVDDNSVSTSTVNPVKLRLLNGLNGATGSAALSYNASLVGEAAFGTASAPQFVHASAALAQLVTSYGGSTPLTMSNVTLEAGKVYTLFLGGAPGALASVFVADR